MHFRFSLGDTVRSPKVGVCKAFVGEIVFARHIPESQSFAAHNYYHVRAPDGSEWHRDESELTVEPMAQAAE